VASPSISAIIPAFNEEKTVGEIVSKTLRYVDEVIVIDDGSTDDTGVKAAKAGARVIRNEENAGILKSLKVGFESVVGDVIVTLDADGQHDPGEIPLLLGPIIEGKTDMTLGARAAVPYFSERVIARLTSLRVSVKDASTGFRAIKTDIARRMDLHGSCACGTLILEAKARGARIVDVPINVREREEGERRIQTRHFKQVLYVLYGLVRY
jgi:glycosyltransferase involved in cell wall biosynthesis